MKTLFYVILGIHCLVEIAVAVIMWVNPEIFVAGISPETASMARSFGIGAMAVALLGCFLLFRPSKELVKFGGGTLLAYHLGILSTQIINLWPVFPWSAVIFHGCLVTGLALIISKNPFKNV